MRRLNPLATVLAAALVCCAGLLAQNSADIEHFSQEGQAALGAGRYGDAERAFEKLSQLEPGIAEIQANLGLIYFQERKFELAVPTLRRALKLKPALTKSDSLLAMSLSELGEYSESAPGLEKCFHHSTDPEIKRMCGLELQRAYTGLKRDNKAVEVALELNRRYPGDAEILYQTGKIYGNFAFLTIRKLAQVAPASVWRHLAAGEAEESQGSYDQAIQEYHEVLRLEPNRLGIHYRIGRTLLARFWLTHLPDDPVAAQKEFEQELQLDPANANAAYELGEMHRKAHQTADAQKYFEQALQYYPGFSEAHLGLAAVLMEQKKADQALEHARKAVAADAENAVGWYRLAQIESAVGNSVEQQKAMAEFRRLHEQAPRQRDFNSANLSDVTQQEADPSAKQ
jgi:tetratricopeptide (TPR) repeat protein